MGGGRLGDERRLDLELVAAVVASAEAEPPALYLATDGYEANEFKRTASRLFEMRSNEYLALPHGRNVLGASGSTEGIVET